MNEVDEAVAILNQGGIVIYPTDTAFGIGCRMDREEAVKRLFALRRRPLTQATPVLVSDISMAENYLSPLSTLARNLMQKYWPGGLTIVYPCKIELVPILVRGGSKNMGVRMPNHRAALSLIEQIGVPILGPSANFHGEPTPYAFEQLNPVLTKLVDYIVPGACTLRQASTVVDCSTEPVKIVRQGAVKIAEV